MLGRISLIMFIIGGVLLYLGLTNGQKYMMVAGLAGLFLGVIGMAVKIRRHPATGWLRRL